MSYDLKKNGKVEEEVNVYFWNDNKHRKYKGLLLYINHEHELPFVVINSDGFSASWRNAELIEEPKKKLMTGFQLSTLPRGTAFITKEWGHFFYTPTIRENPDGRVFINLGQISRGLDYFAGYKLPNEHEVRNFEI